jgi:hypothetical protein
MMKESNIIFFIFSRQIGIHKQVFRNMYVVLPRPPY